jgi:hypothetical protein
MMQLWLARSMRRPKRPQNRSSQTVGLTIIHDGSTRDSPRRSNTSKNQLSLSNLNRAFTSLLFFSAKCWSGSSFGSIGKKKVGNVYNLAQRFSVAEQGNNFACTGSRGCVHDESAEDERSVAVSSVIIGNENFLLVASGENFSARAHCINT